MEESGNVQDSLSLFGSQLFSPFPIFHLVLLFLLDRYSLIFPSTNFLEFRLDRRQDVLEIGEGSD